MNSMSCTTQKNWQSVTKKKTHILYREHYIGLGEKTSVDDTFDKESKDTCKKHVLLNVFAGRTHCTKHNSR